MRETPLELRQQRGWQDSVGRVIDAVAGMTAVDGATVMTDRFDLLAFGAKITRRDGRPQVEQLTVTEPIEGGVAAVVHPTELGGTRHLSAAQFVQDQHDATAFVASQEWPVHGLRLVALRGHGACPSGGNVIDVARHGNQNGLRAN